MSSLFGPSAADVAKDQAAQARNDEMARQSNVQMGTDAINSTLDSQFTPAYYDKQRQSYLDYADPQLQQQYAKAKNDLTYSLARSGTLNSSIRSGKEGDLTQLYDTNSRQVADQAQAQANTQKGNVESARSNLISNVNATGDSTAAANSALSQANVLSQPAAYSPLSDLFASFTSGLGVQAAQEKAAALSGGTYQSKYNTGLFGTPTNAVQVS